VSSSPVLLRLSAGNCGWPCPSPSFADNIWGCGQPNYECGQPSRGYECGQPNRGYGDYKTETGMECEFQENGLFAAFFFVLYMIFAAFLVLNLFIGIITTEMAEAKIEAEKKRKTKNKLALATRLRTMQFKDGGNDVEDGGANSDGNPIYDTEDRNTFEEEGAGASSGGVIRE